MSTQWRIMVRQLPLLVLLFVGVLYWLAGSIEKSLYGAYEENARSSGHLAVRAVEASMRTESTHPLWERVAERLPRQEGTEIEVVNPAGRLLFSTARDAPRADYRQDSGACAGCHSGVATGDAPAEAYFEDPERPDLQVYAAPLRNGADCRPCHEDDGPKLGVVFVRRSLEPIHDRVRRVIIGLIIAGTIALVFTVLTTRYLLARHLGRPVGRLVRGAREIGAGNLAHVIELDEPSELTILADTLNRSAAELKRTIETVEQQRNEFETLYRVTDQLGRGILPESRRRSCVELLGQVLGRPAILIRRYAAAEPSAVPGTVTCWSPEGGTVDRVLAEDLGDLPLATAPVREFLERWDAGDLDGQARSEADSTVAYPLGRHGNRLGLVLTSSASAAGGPPPELVAALCRHLAIALEYSDMQRETIAQERLAAIGETLAGLAHCIKNVLNGLRAGQYVIDRAMKTNDSSKLETGWRVMKSSVRQVERLAHDMVYYVKDRIPERTPVDPNEIMREVADLLAESAAERDVEIRPELDAELAPVALDRTAIYRAVLNLVSNAIDACVESETGDLVTLRSQLSGSELILSVTDNGIGMTAELLAQLNTRFFSTKASRGTGLGLPVVRKIAEEHGGTLQVDSTPGTGSSFRLHLPVTSSLGSVSPPS